MIRSMTAYAGGERVTRWGTLGCELRSVNHRFLEVGVRLPEELRALEPQLRERVAGRISRGKLDLVMRLRAPEAATSLAVDEALVEQLSEVAQRLHGHFLNMRINFTDLLQYPGVLRGEATDVAALQAEAPPGVSVERFRPDFRAVLAGADLSISMAGYNTALDILQTGVRSVLIPFAEGGETEQALRAQLFAEAGRAVTVEQAGLTPEALAAAVDQAADLPPVTLALALDGARRTAEILTAREAAR